MSVVDRGREAIEAQMAAERHARERYDLDNERAVRFHHRLSFGSRQVETHVENWRPLDPEPHNSYGPSMFECDGLTWIVEWHFEGNGGDRAYWDNGWWPDWYLVLPRRWLPFLTRRVQVFGPQNVAEAVRR